MAKKKSLFKNEYAGKTSYLKNLKEYAREARIKRAKNRSKEDFQQYIDENEEKYRGFAGHNRYKSIMDKIPEDERQYYRGLDSDDVFYWGRQIDDIGYEDANMLREQFEEEELERAKKSLDLPPDEPLQPA